MAVARPRAYSGCRPVTGDTHLPDAESDLAVEEGASGLAALARERTQPGRANTLRRAGLLRDQDETTGGTETTGPER